jgi:hypothetical protein
MLKTIFVVGSSMVMKTRLLAPFLFLLAIAATAIVFTSSVEDSRLEINDEEDINVHDWPNRAFKPDEEVVLHDKPTITWMDYNSDGKLVIHRPWPGVPYGSGGLGRCGFGTGGLWGGDRDHWWSIFTHLELTIGPAPFKQHEACLKEGQSWN